MDREMFEYAAQRVREELERKAEQMWPESEARDLYLKGVIAALNSMRAYAPPPAA